MLGNSLAVCSRKERTVFLSDSRSEGVKRLEPEEGSAFGLGEGFNGSCDVVVLGEFSNGFTAKPLGELLDGLLAYSNHIAFGR